MSDSAGPELHLVRRLPSTAKQQAGSAERIIGQKFTDITDKENP